MLQKSGILQSYCIANKNYSIYGDYYTEQFQYLKIGLELCLNSTESGIVCKSRQEQQKFFNGRYLTIMFKN